MGIVRMRSLDCGCRIRQWRGDGRVVFEVGMKKAICVTRAGLVAIHQLLVSMRLFCVLSRLLLTRPLSEVWTSEGSNVYFLYNLEADGSFAPKHAKAASSNYEHQGIVESTPARKHAQLTPSRYLPYMRPHKLHLPSLA